MEKRMVFRIIPILIMFCVVVTNIYGYGGFGDGFDSSVIPAGDEVTAIKTPVQKLWNTISLILQVCAVGGIIFTGVRYMFASADAKSDMKQTLPYLLIGMIIVFASPTIIDFIVAIVNDITN